MTTMTVPAADVREGDFLPGLDNGYVYEDPTTDVPPYIDGSGNVIARQAEDERDAGGPVLLSICFHTADGDEAELIVPDTMPVTVKRG